MVEKSRGFQVSAHALMVLLSLFCIAPFALLLMSSFTTEHALTANGFSFFPKELSVEAYKYILADSDSMIAAYGLSFLVTVVGTLGNLLLTTLFAYPLFRKDLPGRGFFAFFLFFTMLFSGGLVPSYILWTRTFRIQNTLFALLIPNLLMNAFNVIMMRTYFTTNIPNAVIEAARIDGANEFRILWRVVLPMAMPILAALVVLVGLGYWNDWTNGLYYINDDRLHTVQVLLMNIQRSMEAMRQSAQRGGMVANVKMPSTGVRMAVTVMCILPIMVVYPFLQKSFVKGISIGAVKG
jgi:putative aldouronate transport system permease protein